MIRNMRGILGIYTCSACQVTHTFSEKYPSEKVRRFLCPHFNLVLSMIRSFNKFKMQISSACNLCYKQYNSELKIGNVNFANREITEDTYVSECCGNKIESVISLSEEYFDQNEPSDIHTDILNPNNNNINRNNNRNNNNSINFNNNNNINNSMINQAPMMMNFNMGFNMNNQMPMINNSMMNNNNNFNMRVVNNRSNMDYLNKLDPANVIQLSQKNKLVNFLEESSNKYYKIYTSPKLRLRTVLNDLLNLYPEINYLDNNLIINQNILSLNSTIESLNLNDNTFILIKNNNININ